MKRVRDPIHGTINVPQRLLPVVDHPVYQRLRGIRQTGTAHLVYPGANHGRFEHSLGAYHLATLATDALGLDDQEVLDVHLAALLHDVGHSPLSHLTEHVLSRWLKRPHEALSVDLIRTELREAIEGAGGDPRVIGGLVRGKGPHAGLVSGALDVDRLDYTIRDGHYTGVAVGVNADRILESLVETREGVALDVSGLNSAEGLLMARFALRSAVYFHHACRAGEVMIQRALDLALEDGALDPAEVARMDDGTFLTRLRDVGGTPGDLVQRVQTRRLHKVAHEVRYRDLPPTAREALLDRRVREELEARLRDVAGPEVVIDAPPITTLPDVEMPVMTPEGPRLLTEVSTMVRSLAEASLDHLHARVYVPASRRDEAEPVARRALRFLHGLDEYGPP